MAVQQTNWGAPIHCEVSLLLRGTDLYQGAAQAWVTQTQGRALIALQIIIDKDEAEELFPRLQPGLKVMKAALLLASPEDVDPTE